MPIFPVQCFTRLCHLQPVLYKACNSSILARGSLFFPGNTVLNVLIFMLNLLISCAIMRECEMKIMKLQIKDVWTERYLSGFSFGYSWSRTLQARAACDIWHPMWGSKEYCQKSQIWHFCWKMTFPDISLKWLEWGPTMQLSPSPLSTVFSRLGAAVSAPGWSRMVQDVPAAVRTCQDVPGRARAP